MSLLREGLVVLKCNCNGLGSLGSVIGTSEVQLALSLLREGLVVLK